ncbi:MAG TPA: dTDP-glucose 4,6-dehydratase [Verrucomicrobiae bacterium]|nr:dTDP-glucose 4,6-dehydratase [Verrucomicrobiae bacterium]
MGAVTVRRVLVTGGAGFIGSHFVKVALREHPDWHILNLDKLSYAGNLENLAELPDANRHEFIKGDITDHEAVAGVWRDGIDCVVNFAAETHVDRSILWADEFIKTDVLGTFTLLEAARQFGVKKFIQISTDEVYGSISQGSFTEDSPLNPRNPYSASKAGADRLAFAYFATHQVPVIVTRCSNNFGPNQHPEKFIPLFITNALEDKPLPLYGDGRYVRDWIYVEDHCAAIDFLIAHGTAGETFNIAGGNEVENIEIARRVLRKLGKPESLIQLVKDRPGHDRRYSLEAGRLAALGWKPQRDFAESLDDTVDWYARNERWWRKIKSGDFQKYYAAQYGPRL